MHISRLYDVDGDGVASKSEVEHITKVSNITKISNITNRLQNDKKLTKCWSYFDTVKSGVD